MDPDHVAMVNTLVETIRRSLAGQPPDVQGGVLADLVSIYIAGHHPQLREEVMRLHVEAALGLVAVNEQILFGGQGFPIAGAN